MNFLEEKINYTEKVREKIKGKNLKYIVLTMGCQLNENDSEKISGMVEEMGYTVTEKFNEADLVIFNTCCVRENAEERLFGKLGEIKKMKEQRNVVVAIGGCMMQEKSMLDKIKKSYRYVDVVFGTHTTREPSRRYV
jgi:tRNA-2-methylthio-N6-dimethylallyladenosine synthase